MLHPAIIAAICASSIALLLIVMFVVWKLYRLYRSKNKVDKSKRSKKAAKRQANAVAESENAAKNVEEGKNSKEKQASNGGGKAVPGGKKDKEARSKKQLKVHNSPSSDLVVSTGEKKPRKKYQNMKKVSIREIRINMDPPSRPTEDPPTYGGTASNSKCSVNLESQDASLKLRSLPVADNSQENGSSELRANRIPSSDMKTDEQIKSEC